MPSEVKSAYLLGGSDEAKLDTALRRLRERATADGGATALETFSAPDGAGPPDAEGLLSAASAMSLMPGRRYLLADGVERWKLAQAREVAEALPGIAEEVTIVLVARGEAPKKQGSPEGKVRGELAKAVAACGGEVREYEAPRAGQLPRRLVADAAKLGFTLDAGAAKLLVERMGESTLRLANELQRLATWAGPGGAVSFEDLEAMVRDESEQAAWALSDAIVARDIGAAATAVETFIADGESVTPLVYGAAKRLRPAREAARRLEAGERPDQIAASLAMHPYAAKQIVAAVRGADEIRLRAATCAIADLEWWTRGGAEYPDDTALAIAARRAASS